jgi:Glycosyl hydrolase family 65, N-terminal domain
MKTTTRRTFLEVAAASVVCAADAAKPPQPGPLTLWYRQTAAKWEEALPVGNGRLGAMIFGGVEKERLQLNEITVWSGALERNADRMDGYESVEPIRKLIREEKYQDAVKAMMAHRTSNAGGRFGQGTYGSYQTLGDLNLEYPGMTGQPANYQRWLDLDEAVAGVSFEIDGATWTREIFSSAVDQALIVRISCSRKGAVAFTARLNRVKFAQTSRMGSDTLAMKGTSTGQPGDLRFEAQLRARAVGGTVSVSDDAISVQNADEAILFLAAGTDYALDYANAYKGPDPHDAVNDALSKTARRPYAAVRRDHVRDYQRFFHRVSLDLGIGANAELPTDDRLRKFSSGEDDPSLISLFYQYGRYLLGGNGGDSGCNPPGPGGPGGPGGRGGDAGAAGRGGDGGKGGLITVQTLVAVPQGVISSQAPGGDPGSSGINGAPGAGGLGGVGGINHHFVHHGQGSHGSDGWYDCEENGRAASGPPGMAGSPTPQPAAAVPGPPGEISVRLCNYADLASSADPSHVSLLLHKAAVQYLTCQYVPLVSTLRWVERITREAPPQAEDRTEWRGYNRNAAGLLAQLSAGLDYYSLPRNYVPLVTFDSFDAPIKEMLSTATRLEQAYADYYGQSVAQQQQLAALQASIRGGNDYLQNMSGERDSLAKSIGDIQDNIASLSASIEVQQIALMAASDSFRQAVERQVPLCTFSDTIRCIRMLVAVMAAAYTGFTAIVAAASAIDEKSSLADIVTRIETVSSNIDDIKEKYQRLQRQR